MKPDKYASLFSRVFFGVSMLLLVVAVLEKVVNLAGYTLTRSYQPQRLLELAATMMVFVIALLLRQVREVLKHPGR